MSHDNTGGNIALSALQAYGYFVAEAIGDEIFTKGAINEIKTYLEHQPRIDNYKIRLNNITNLTRQDAKKLSQCWEPIRFPSTGILMCPPMFHLSHIWELRQTNYIVDMFSTIYNTDKKNIRVDIDTINVKLPSSGTREGCFWNSNPKEWTNNNDLDIRGEFALTDITLYFVPKTNTLAFRDLFVKVYSNISYDNITKIDPNNDPWKLSQREIAINVPAGSLIIWDSKLLQNTYPNNTSNITFSVNLSYKIDSKCKVNTYHRVKSYLTGQAPEILPSGLRYSYMPDAWIRYPKQAEKFHKKLPDYLKKFRKANDGKMLAELIEPNADIMNYKPHPLSELGYTLLWGKPYSPTFNDLEALEQI